MLLIGMAQQSEIVLIPLVVFAVICCVVGLILMRRLPSQRQVLNKWAEMRGLHIQEAQRRSWFCGRFTFIRSSAQTVFRITVSDASGRVRKGFARVGGCSGLGDYVKVAWDREPRDADDVRDCDDGR